ncbi:MAG: family 2 glycosyl transferase, partial [Spirochaetales bacterium]|nr:family 2 glycosyl transferase [Spirochaetales bacterium]
QRGVFLLNTPEDLPKAVPEVLQWSRQREFILEEFYPSEEVTVNGWVTGGILHILTVVDRVTRMFPPHIGICTAHRYPSRHLGTYGDRIIRLSRDIVKAAGIFEGPVYFQMLIGNEGIKVNEIACRLGGAYEDRYIAFETGVNTLDLLIDASLGKTISPDVFSRVPFPGYNHIISVPLVFTRSGRIGKNGPVADVLTASGVIGGGYLLPEGLKVEKTENSTRRAAWAVVTGKTPGEVNTALDELFSRLTILDGRGENMVLDTRKDAYAE